MSAHTLCVCMCVRTHTYTHSSLLLFWPWENWSPCIMADCWDHKVLRGRLCTAMCACVRVRVCPLLPGSDLEVLLVAERYRLPPAFLRKSQLSIPVSPVGLQAPGSLCYFTAPCSAFTLASHRITVAWNRTYSQNKQPGRLSTLRAGPTLRSQTLTCPLSTSPELFLPFSALFPASPSLQQAFLGHCALGQLYWFVPSRSQVRLELQQWLSRF